MFLSFLVATAPTLSDSKWLSTTNWASDNNPCYWFCLSSSYFTHSLLTHTLLHFYSLSHNTHITVTLPQGPLSNPNPSDSHKTVPSFPVFPLLSSGSIFTGVYIQYDTVPQAVWPTIAMTTGGKHLSSQNESRFPQPHVRLWALLLLDVYGSECVACVCMCACTFWYRNHTMTCQHLQQCAKTLV